MSRLLFSSSSRLLHGTVEVNQSIEESLSWKYEQRPKDNLEKRKKGNHK
jgi:hypothetical protein